MATDKAPPSFPDGMLRDQAAPHIPHDRDSEEALIGCLLVSPDLYTAVAATVSPRDFYIQRLGWIMEAFAAIRERGGDADIVSVGAELGQRGQLEEAGGPAFLTSLLTRMPTTLHFETYARTVLDRSIKRGMLGLANRVAEQCYGGVASAEIISGLGGALDDLVSRIGAVENTSRPFAEIAGEHYDAVSHAANHPGERGIETPWSGLNNILRYGWKPRFYIIAGRPGKGKSKLLENAAYHAAFKLKKRVAYFCQEQSRTETFNRIISRHTGIDAHRLENGELAGDDWAIYTRAIEELSALSFFILDTPGLSPLQMRAQCRRIEQQHGPIDLVVEDYLQLQAVDLNEKLSSRALENRVQEVSYITRQLKILSRTLNAPVLAAAQMNRNIEARAVRKPMLSDLRESGSLEMDADVVGFLYEDERPDHPNTMHLDIQKNRQTGLLGTLDLLNLPTHFEDMPAPG
jgi:replicative DNA helicase